jgi:hypothetical protein
MKRAEYFAEVGRLGNIYSNKLSDLKSTVDIHVSLISNESLDSCINAELEMIRAGKEWKDFCIQHRLTLTDE